MSSSKLATYSPEDVEVIVAGVFNISGFSEGSLININKQKSSFTYREYPDGTIVRNFTNSGVYEVELVLSATSDSNNVLTSLAAVDRLTLLGRFPLLIRDMSGESVFFSPSSWISGMPNEEYSAGITTRIWNITSPNSSSYIGGNYSASSGLEDIVGILVGMQ